MPKKNTVPANAGLAVLFAFLAGAAVSGKADPFLLHVPLLSWGFGLILLACIATALRGAFVGRPAFARLGAAFGLTFLAICAVHFSAHDATYGYPASSLFIAYYAVVLLYASLGAAQVWLGVVALILCTELWSLFAAGYLNVFGSSEWRELLLHRVSPLVRPMAGLVLSGLIPFVIGRIKTAGEKSQKSTSPGRPAPLEASPPRLAATQASSPIPTSAAPSKTQIMMLEQDTGIYNKSGMDDLLSSVVYFMSRNFKAYSALGFVFDPQKKVFILNSFHSKNYSIIAGLEIPLGKGIVGRVGMEKNSFMSGDLSLYPEKLLYYGASEAINSALVVPILSDARELLGALVVDSMDKNWFTEQNKDTMRRFSVLAAALITNVRMRLYQEKAAKSFQIFYEASQQFITALRTSQVFDVLFRMIGLLTPATRMITVTFNEQTRRGVVHKVVGPSPDIAEGLEFPINAGLYSYSFTKLAIVNIGAFQAYRGKYYRFLDNESSNPAIQSLIIIPIFDDEQRILGLLSIESDAPNQFAGETEKYLSTLLGNASVAITRAQLYQKMETLATTDGLTLLNNHRTFQEVLAKEVERSRRYGRPLSLLMMDIDHFKKFNDTYGHPVGDLVLKEISGCIRQSIRINDIAARYGGEEFTVIIPETGPEGAMVIAERIRRTVEQHTIVSLDNRLHVTISLGCAVMPLVATAQQPLIDAADKALYFSKERGRNRTTLFSPEMGQQE
jgi:diguanylate cyclase (GGDEF)-like protein